jgi:hypothetical protein
MNAFFFLPPPPSIPLSKLLAFAGDPSGRSNHYSRKA